jgi:pimeloyl-[acyl-carrier protein] methyl ester esterase
LNNKPPLIVLLPGMDGTGDLFRDFVAALPRDIQTEVVRYPFDVCLSEAQLSVSVRSAMPTAEPFVLLAESFSTPLAIRYAATNPANLRGLVLCAGFASSPVRGTMRLLGLLLAPLLAKLTLPDFLMRAFFVGRDASGSLKVAVRLAVSSARPAVMATRIHFVLGCNVRKQLSDVRVPMLYIQATQDRLVSRRCMKEILGIKPETAVGAVDGPHLILQREPKRTAEIVAEFIHQLS